ncbi:hypothetical protein AMK16_30850 [Streptomyces sp. CB00455]|uniref:hypothetical protein n=1 Tax=Streptomyces sp. CB00455 TaxID=1703927 RepID=UPI0009396D01|nr:hypothetical protein [Streptomyces sp. CB00455]OKK14250.1 hypothetical protein AMK16_30850 [Streptomyces sp. CB00455]
MSGLVDGTSIAAGVGEGIADDGGRFGGVAAWAWFWRTFDMSLPDVGGAAWQSDPAAPTPVAVASGVAGLAPPFPVGALARSLL